MKEKIIFSWSGGKDSAYALFQLLQDNRYKIHSLFTTLSYEFKRINFHGVRAELLDNQAKALSLNLDKIFLTRSNTIDEYAEKLEPNMIKSEFLK